MRMVSIASLVVVVLQTWASVAASTGADPDRRRAFVSGGSFWISGAMCSAIRNGSFRFGYGTDPVPGGEDAALACRRAGAWSFHSSKCDDATLAFLAKYDLRIFLLLDGEAKEMIGTLNRIGKSPYAQVIMGVQLGTDPTGGADTAKWRSVARVAAKSFPDRPVALPVKDEKAPILAEMRETLSLVTHLMVDLRGEAAPYAKLNRMAQTLRTSSDERYKKLRLWAIAPGNLPGQQEEKASSPSTLAWQMHWLMSACAVETVDGVFFDRRYRQDAFGILMRHLWVSLAAHPMFVAHGEGTRAKERSPKKRASEPLTELDLDSRDAVDSLAGEELDDSAPQACANVAAGKPGDVEYLVFAEPPNGSEVLHGCVVAVNTRREKVLLNPDLWNLDPRVKYGLSKRGFRRSLRPDGESGGMVNMTTERIRYSPEQLGEWIGPGEIVFIEFQVL